MNEQDKALRYIAYFVLGAWYMGAAATQYMFERKEAGRNNDKLVMILYPELEITDLQ